MNKDEKTPKEIADEEEKAARAENPLTYGMEGDLDTEVQQWFNIQEQEVTAAVTNHVQTLVEIFSEAVVQSHLTHTPLSEIDKEATLEVPDAALAEVCCPKLPTKTLILTLTRLTLTRIVGIRRMDRHL